MTVLQTFVWLAVLMLSENLISIARGYDGYQDHFDNFIWLSDVGEPLKKTQTRAQTSQYHYLKRANTLNIPPASSEFLHLLIIST